MYGAWGIGNEGLGFRLGGGNRPYKVERQGSAPGFRALTTPCVKERESDPNKRANKCNAEAGRKGKAKGEEGGKAGRREKGEKEANIEEKQEKESKKHTKRRKRNSRSGSRPAHDSEHRTSHPVAPLGVGVWRGARNYRSGLDSEPWAPKPEL